MVQSSAASSGMVRALCRGAALLVILASSCVTSYHSGCSGSLVAGKVATAELVVPESCRSVSLSGTVTLESGQVVVSLGWPGSGSRTFSFNHDGSGGSQVITVGPFEQAAQGGIWTLTVTGGQATSGAYDLAMDAR